MDNEWTQITPGLAVELTRSLFCGLRDLEKRVAVFVAYSDETGGPGPRDMFLVGGYVASVRTWLDFSDAWAERVLGAPPTIPYLHMVELRRAAFQKEHRLSGLTAQDRVREAVQVIAGTAELSWLAGRIERAAFQDVLQRKMKEVSVPLTTGLDKADYNCFLVYSWLVLEQVHLCHPEAEKVDFVVSTKSGVTEHLDDFHDGLKEYAGAVAPHLSHLVGELIPGRMETRMPLQAADLLCWHLQRRHQGTADRTDNDNLGRLGSIPGKEELYDETMLGGLSESLLQHVRETREH